ncbi:MAG: class I SAM-dependent methyltransferase [Halobacteria archaeon]|nr:class I SAM-dependent methyltransferase [Halobacteria archaeon]
MSPDRDAHEVYGRRAESYAEKNHSADARERYEWPAVRQALPELKDKRILDAGCGSGYYSAWMARRGAEVVGVDASKEMVEVATDLYGDVARFRHADLREPLDGFDDGEFDLVVSQLTLEHIEDWTLPMNEFARVLNDEGELVVSCDHPFTTYFVIEHEPSEIGSPDIDNANYYDVEGYNRVWGEGDDRIEIPCYRRSLEDVFAPVFGAGLAVDEILEPLPKTEDNRFLEYFKDETPRFLVFRAHKI